MVEDQQQTFVNKRKQMVNKPKYKSRSAAITAHVYSGIGLPNLITKLGNKNFLMV